VPVIFAFVMVWPDCHTANKIKKSAAKAIETALIQSEGGTGLV